MNFKTEKCIDANWLCLSPVHNLMVGITLDILGR